MLLSQEEIDQKNMGALMALLAWMGSRKRLAEHCSVSPQAVYDWVKRGRISATCAKIIEEKTSGMFTKEYLRVDVKEWNQ